ncbi:MAG TPA: DUF1761 domain-containing protein [Gemmatimonadales bacterium]|jgi:hypothetical protein|nr:DUF1761 domain-containing protein [Gemmatimonadales bacterium]
MMSSPPLLPVVVSAVAIFITGWLWYSPLMFLKPWMRLRGLDPATAMSGKMPMGRVGLELVRCLVISYLVMHLAMGIELGGLYRAVHAGLFLWVTFPVMLLFGQAIWENMHWKVAAINAGDWLVKLLLIPVIYVLMK